MRNLIVTLTIDINSTVVMTAVRVLKSFEIIVNSFISIKVYLHL